MSFFKQKPVTVKTTIETQIEELREQLRRQQAIQNLANRIHAAQNMKQIIVDLKDEFLRLYDASLITIYAADSKVDEIYSMFLAGSTLTEIRLPVNNGSIAGFSANNRQTVNITDAYDESELQMIHPDLHFDRRWDQKSGIRTTQILAVPILHEGRLMGVVQILNKKGGGPFTEDDRMRLEELAHVLGIAFFNQERIRKKKKSRFDHLLRHGLIRDEELESSWGEARKSRETIEDYLMKKFKIPREAIIKSLEEFFGCPYVSFSSKFPIPFDLLRNLKEEYLRRELWVPLERKEGKVRVLIDDPNNILKRDMIENLLKLSNVEYCVTMYDDILRFINHFYQSESGRETIDDLIGKLDVDEVEEEEDAFSESDSIIMQLVNKIIRDAYGKGASDIHVEPNTMTRNVEIRVRVDGDLSLYQTVPFSYRSAIISRIKIMSNLDITERRLPQDGKIRFKRSRGEEIELRVATVPTQGGVEDVVMRILAKGDTMPLESLALSPRNYQSLLDLLDKPYGIILAVGPTGSGKTTTLHAALRHINTPETKIWTAEDPVEITQNGLRQVQVNPKVGLDFAHAMRSFLRADPDVIMVGEMRDYETAKTAVEASLTGHLVLSTLHTNSAPETIVRLLDMGIDPLNFADSLLGILAQRLVRTLCVKCREKYHPDREEFDLLVRHYGGDEAFSRLKIPYDDNFTLYRPKGCPQCDNQGYKGRMGIHELLAATREIKHLIQERATVEDMREMAISQGMTTLLQDGIDKVLRGHTDLFQVLRVCFR